MKNVSLSEQNMQSTQFFLYIYKQTLKYLFLYI